MGTSLFLGKVALKEKGFFEGASPANHHEKRQKHNWAHPDVILAEYLFLGAPDTHWEIQRMSPSSPKWTLQSGYKDTGVKEGKGTHRTFKEKGLL